MTQPNRLNISSNYYPFGMAMEGRKDGDQFTGEGNGYRYGFNGKESNPEWNGNVGGSYDFGARIYDPRLGRFLSMDPLTKQFPFMTPYNYASNNPIRLVDKLGKGPGDPPFLTGNDKFDAQLETVYQTFGDENTYTISYTYHQNVDQNGKLVSEGGSIGVVDNEGVTVFEYAQNDIYENSDANSGKIALENGFKGLNEYGAYTLMQGERARNYYNKNVKDLAPDDGKARTKLKIKARAKTPTIPRVIAETKKPITEEGKRQTGTANKTNAKWNRNAKILGRVGKGMGALAVVTAGYNIATAEDKSEAVAEEAGVLAGALVGAKVGAEAGALIGAVFGGVTAVPGAIIGGVVGSIVGGIIGGEVGKGVHNEVEKAIEDKNVQ